jgi:phosphatidyl-myo-inositol alpha-mannosyltransferase
VRIALACPYAWDSPGGVQVHVRQLSEHLVERGHETLILAPGRVSPEDRTVRIVSRPIRVPYQGTVAPISPSPFSLRRVGEVLRPFRPDVVHAHEPLIPSTSLFAVLGARGPVVGTFHAHAERSALLTAAAPVLRRVWRRLDVRIAVSQAAAGFVTSRFGQGVRIVPNGCDVELFEEAVPAEDLPPGRRMLWVGRLDPQKGFPVAVRAFAQLATDLPDLVFVVAGEGRDRDALGGLDSAVRERVVMLGTVPHDRLPRYHSAADVFVAPALGQESFGIVLVEAMAAGVPIVATDIAGYREVVHPDVEGLVVPPDDPPAVAAAVHRVLTDPSLAERLSRAGRARAQRYRWSVVVEEIEAAYREALEASAARRHEPPDPS